MHLGSKECPRHYLFAPVVRIRFFLTSRPKMLHFPLGGNIVYAPWEYYPPSFFLSRCEYIICKIIVVIDKGDVLFNFYCGLQKVNNTNSNI